MQFVRQSPLVRLSAIILFAGCGGATTTDNERTSPDGVWEVVATECAGLKREGFSGVEYEFGAGQFRVIRKGEAVGSWQKYNLNVTTSPKQMNWEQKTITLKKSVEFGTLRGIYYISGDQMQICMPTTPNIPRPTAFETARTTNPEGKNIVLWTFKRVPVADAKEEQERHQAADAAARAAAYRSLGSVVSSGTGGAFKVDFHKFFWTRNVAKKEWQDLLDLNNISELDLRGCSGVGDDQMQHVARLVALKTLDLHSTDVSNAGVVRLSELKSLEDLDLSFTSITDTGLAMLAQFPKLKRVILNGTCVTASAIRKLRAAREHLEVVWGRSYTESQREAAVALSRLGFEIGDNVDRYVQPKMVTCQVLFPCNVKIRDPSVAKPDARRPLARTSGYGGSLAPSTVAAYVEQLPSPLAVDVGDDAMDDTIFVCLGNVQGLVRLNLRGTRVTDTGLVELKHHQGLKMLNLSLAKNLTDKGVARLAALANLEILDLEGIGVTPAGLAPLLTLGHLKALTFDRKALNSDLNWKFRQKGVTLRLR